MTESNGNRQQALGSSRRGILAIHTSEKVRDYLRDLFDTRYQINYEIKKYHENGMKALQIIPEERLAPGEVQFTRVISPESKKNLDELAKKYKVSYTRICRMFMEQFLFRVEMNDDIEDFPTHRV